LKPITASSTVPARANRIATQIREWLTGPIHGSSVICADRVHRIGRKAISVMTDRMKLTPSPSTMRAKRIVSSWMRWDAPSMPRTRCQWAA
jgi:hypothetical protein